MDKTQQVMNWYDSVDDDARRAAFYHLAYFALLSEHINVLEESDIPFFRDNGEEITA
jgi:hypothetical protein